MSERQSLNFRTNVLIKSIIGKDLINDDNIAVLELVKNSYDAASPTVDIIFKNLKQNDDLNSKTYSTNSSKIIIQDFGKGMDEDDIKDKWLNIAYSAKKSIKEENNRYLAGNKGVGRFSCDRLGEYLDLYTRKKDKDYFHLKINWKDFETDDKGLDEKKKQDLEIQQIKVYLTTIPAIEFEQTTGHKSFEQGTVLEISKIRSQWAVFEQNKKENRWNLSKIEKLKKYLEKLINPNQAFQKTSFSIFLWVNDFLDVDFQKEKHEQLSGKVENKIFKKLDFTTTSIESFISTDGKTITTNLVDKGKTIFILEEKNIDFPLLKDIRVYLHFLNTYAKIYFAKQSGVRVKQFGSIFLFLNGFMIPPYGEENDDWLGLEIRKGQGNKRNLSTRDLVGGIEIKDGDNNFKPISNRAGIVKNDYFTQLVDGGGYFYYTFKRLEKFVVEGLKWDRITGKEDLEEEQSIEQNRDKIRREFEEKIKNLSLEDAQKQEIYYEDEIVKKRRVFDLVKNIINVKEENIVDLYINEDLILDLVREEEKHAKDNLQKLINELEQLTSTDVDNGLQKIERDKNTLQNVIDRVHIVSKNVTDTKTLSALNETQNIFNNFNELYSSLKLSLVKAVAEKKEYEARIKQEEEERANIEEYNRKLEEELALEKEKNTYLRTSSRSLSEDSKGLVHNIQFTTKKINSVISNLYDTILTGELEKKHILNELGKIKYLSDKSLKISKIINRSNFNTERLSQKIDIVKYIVQYIDIYSEIYEKSQLKFHIVDHNISFEKLINPLELSIIFDDLISNAEKAEADNILIEFKNQKQTLIIFFSDDGNGLDKKFFENPDKIFELGVTTTNGSGIGLHSVRTALKTIRGKISFVGNNVNLKGACFEITIE